MSQRVISFHYKLTDPSGKTLDSSEGEQPMSFLEGVGQIIPGLEAVLQKLKVGDKEHLKIPADKAYGARDKKLVVEVPRDQMPKKAIQVGDRFKAD